MTLLNRNDKKMPSRELCEIYEVSLRLGSLSQYAWGLSSLLGHCVALASLVRDQQWAECGEFCVTRAAFSALAIVKARLFDRGFRPELVI